jgi:nucleotide-binding universal stress UspA family protein
MSTQKIVVGVNGSTASDAALEWAIHEAARRGAEIIAVHVLKPVDAHGGASVMDVRLRELDYLGKAIRSRVKKELLEPLTRTDIKHRIVVVEGHPATGILDVADTEDADLIVVGTGLHSAIEDLLLGSVADELSHTARRPFALIPFPARLGSVDAMGRRQVPAPVPRQTWTHRTGAQIDEFAAAVSELIR